ncbi:MAG: nitroreductase family protein [Anaerolineales bacterium]|nr:nitroreductase family protein [Anaerolineales bacterium]
MPTKEDLHTFLRTRRSIRRFKPDPVPDSVIESILHTATFAPSAHNRQPWRFAVVINPAVKTRLGEAITSKMRADMQAEGADKSDIDKRATLSLRRMDEAPLVIVLCHDKTDVRADTPEEAVMGIQSTALAGLQLLLAAHAEGLGSNWICWALYAQEATRSALELPETWEPQAMYFLGYPDENPAIKEMKDLKSVILTVDGGR